jgi:hypothetical protein
MVWPTKSRTPVPFDPEWVRRRPVWLGCLLSHRGYICHQEWPESSLTVVTARGARANGVHSPPSLTVHVIPEHLYREQSMRQRTRGAIVICPAALRRDEWKETLRGHIIARACRVTRERCDGLQSRRGHVHSEKVTTILCLPLTGRTGTFFRASTILRRLRHCREDASPLLDEDAPFVKNRG